MEVFVELEFGKTEDDGSLGVMEILEPTITDITNFVAQGKSSKNYDKINCHS